MLKDFQDRYFFVYVLIPNGLVMIWNPFYCTVGCILRDIIRKYIVISASVLITSDGAH